ncbi:hypothetical protein [Virgibacillus salinus]|uniref:Uncharacterized protein n=1 Tax=Virgibacillus salinus TaxID=553311 RepID=A0A1H0ZQM9_9BACI|nr:hypothetical protein [Virgibacillus salinus]SDQ29669.1 hypothetical protein SAMN05216231_1372 [Virgibacillus salinus]
MNNNIYLKYLKWIISCAIILPLFFMIQTTEVQTASTVEYSNNHENSKVSAQTLKKETPEKQLSHDRIVSLTNQFMKTLVQDIDSNNKVVNFDRKKELLEEFEKVTTKNVASEYVDYYYRSKPSGLYIVPTETPPWFNEKNDYDMIEKESNVVKVVQENKSDLDGAYTVKIEFTYNDKWKITDIEY